MKLFNLSFFPLFYIAFIYLTSQLPYYGDAGTKVNGIDFYHSKAPIEYVISRPMSHIWSIAGGENVCEFDAVSNLKVCSYDTTAVSEVHFLHGVSTKVTFSYALYSLPSKPVVGDGLFHEDILQMIGLDPSQPSERSDKEMIWRNKSMARTITLTKISPIKVTLVVEGHAHPE